VQQSPFAAALAVLLYSALCQNLHLQSLLPSGAVSLSLHASLSGTLLTMIMGAGVGASTARMMLSSMKPEEITRAILQGNVKQLESIKGIGKKSAERIILELRDKLGKSKEETINISSLTSNSLEQDALNALITLGIARPAAENAIKKVLSDGAGAEKIEDIIKKALKIL